MADNEQVPPGLDISRPNMARMYDYALGGKDNFAADRAAVEKLFQMSPENRMYPGLPTVPQPCRAFCRRPGHRAVPRPWGGPAPSGRRARGRQAARPDAHIIYVDNNPVVVLPRQGIAGHRRLHHRGSAERYPGRREDLRRSRRGSADRFSRPVATLFVSVLHGIPDNDDPWGIVRVSSAGWHLAATSPCSTSPVKAIQPISSGRRRRSSRSPLPRFRTAAVRISCASSTGSTGRTRLT